nr:acyl-CoA mutase large subunit family protein [candidate division Zixibacteria bacterium]
MTDKNKQTAGMPEKQKLMSDFPAPSYEEWRSEVERLLKGAPFEKRMLTETPEGITLQPLYRAEDCRDLPWISSLPGFAPFIRGFLPLGKKNGGWEIAQSINYPTAAEFNRAVIIDLARGLTSVILPLDGASSFGLDPDQVGDNMVGFDGVSIASLDDLATALKGIDLTTIPIIIETGFPGLPFLGFLLALAKKVGVNPADLKGVVAVDPLGELATRGVLPVSLNQVFDEMAVMTAWANKKNPGFQTIAVRSVAYYLGGGNAVQELAFILATAVEYLRQMEKRGLDIEMVIPHMRLSFGLGNNYFMEVAKLRAARVLWNNVLETCNVPEDKRKIHLHAETSRYTKTKYDPYVNMLRATTEAFSGVVGGVDSLQVAPFDEIIRPADDSSRRIARNTQLILKDEAHLSEVADPAGGSWYIEKLTDQIADAAWSLFRDVEIRGGMIAALEEGYPQDAVAAAAHLQAESAATRKKIIVGTNMYPNASESKLEADLPDYTALAATRTGELTQDKKRQSPDAKAALKKTAGIGYNQANELVDAIVTAASNGATLGQITSALKKSGDPPMKIKPVPQCHAAKQFEKLRTAVENHRAKYGGLQVFLATLGPVAEYMPRLDFSASFFEIGGFEVIRTKGFGNPDENAHEAIKSGAEIVVICGLDDSYQEGVPVIAGMIKKSKPETSIILAGLPIDETTRTRFEQAGVNIFIHMKSNVLKVLTEIASEKGVQL